MPARFAAVAPTRRGSSGCWRRNGDVGVCRPPFGGDTALAPALGRRFVVGYSTLRASAIAAAHGRPVTGGGPGLGLTNEGRPLFVSFTIRRNLVRIISARPMSRRERRIHEEAKATKRS